MPSRQSLTGRQGLAKLRGPLWARRIADDLRSLRQRATQRFGRSELDLRDRAPRRITSTPAGSSGAPEGAPVHPRIAQRRAEVAAIPEIVRSASKRGDSGRADSGRAGSKPSDSKFGQVTPARLARWGLLSVAVLGSVVAALLFSPLADLDHLTIQGVTDGPAESVREATGLTPGTAMFGIRPNEVRSRLESIGWVAHADVDVRWPDKVTASVTPHRPVAVLATAEEPGGDGGSGATLLTASGELLDPEAAGPLSGFAAALPEVEIDTTDPSAADTALQVIGQLRPATLTPLERVVVGPDSSVTLRLDPRSVPGSDESSEASLIEVDMGDAQDMAAKALAVESVVSGTVERACMQRIDVSVPTRVTIRRTSGCTMPGGDTGAPPQQDR